MNKIKKPDISAKAFWDVDFESIDYEKNSLFVMEKVLNFGLWKDVVALFSYYGKERIKKEVVQIADLRKDTISFLSLLLHLKPSDFTCYNRRQIGGRHIHDSNRNENLFQNYF